MIASASVMASTRSPQERKQDRRSARSRCAERRSPLLLMLHFSQCEMSGRCNRSEDGMKRREGHLQVVNFLPRANAAVRGVLSRTLLRAVLPFERRLFERFERMPLTIVHEDAFSARRGPFAFEG